MTLTPAQLGFVKALCTMLLFAVLDFAANAANLTGILGTSTALLVAGMAGSIETYLESKGKGSLFGAVTVKQK